jgi:3-deoxy-7-phosphoheptulonate synthase
MEGLKMFAQKCRANNIKLITEVMELNQIEDMYEYVDVFQVGARNSQNFNLLDALGRCDKPVLLKRAISGTIEELLQSAEYVYSRGNDQLMLCERGIRSFENSYRNTFDINAIAILKEKSHLPVIADPSHGVGIRKHVPAIAMAAAIAGADGIIYEVHPEPEKAKSDAQQTLDFNESQKMIERLRNIMV